MAPYAYARLPSQQPPVLAGGEFYLLNPKDTAMLKAYSRAVARINSVQNDEEGATALARSVLTYAFGAQVIERIPVPSVVRELERAVLEQTGV